MPDDTAINDFISEKAAEFMSESQSEAAEQQSVAVRDYLRNTTGLHDEVDDVAQALGAFMAVLDAGE
jgi:hypothetical protein